MIPFEQIEKLFAFTTVKKFCTEIAFMLTGSEKYDCCWMGKMWSSEEQRDVYWYIGNNSNARMMGAPQ